MMGHTFLGHNFLSQTFLGLRQFGQRDLHAEEPLQLHFSKEECEVLKMKIDVIQTNY